MRVALASSLVVLFACGGAAQKPAETTSSADPPESSASPAENSTPAATEGASPAPAKHAATPPADSAPAADAPAPAYHPTPSVTGSIDGKPFAPKVALVLHPVMKDGRIVLSLTEGTDCAAKAGDPTLTITVPWQNGYKQDFASLKRSTKKGAGEIGIARGSAFSTTFKPTGTVTVTKAPMEQNATGKIKIDLQSGDYLLAGDLDVLLCVAPK